jgi:hypothetical protein
MELQDLIAHFRSQVSDEEAPLLWSDPEVLLYAIDAQDMFVRLTGGIADTTVAAADVGSPANRLQDLAVTTSVPTAAHSPHILRIRSGRLVTAKRDVKFISESGMQQVKVSDYGFTYGLSFDDTEVGVVDYGVLGVRKNEVRWVRVPAVTDTCRLHVYRLPFPRIVIQEDDLEIDVQHHIHLVLWMKHLAYSKQDAETADRKAAQDSGAAFMSYCTQSAQDIARQRYKPRIVQYGGI